MNKTLPILWLLLIVQVHLVAQTKIFGTIVQNDKPLEKVTISVLHQKDSTVLSYTLTDENGKFELIRLPHNTPLILYASHINANTDKRDFQLNTKEHLNFGRIILENRSIEEVVVTALPPVRMNKDTLEYQANYFKTRPQANVEELLKQLPGLQVNMDGSIYYEGQEVSQVKVNGKDFFSNDARIATRNLDASLIKTIQVYRDKGESKKIVDDERNLPITINLKFKKDFLRSDFGKLYASGGTRGRYEAGALFNTFRDTLQVSLIGFGNNINRQSFDYNELNQHAGLGRGENYGFESFGGRNYWGKANDMGGGINLNNDWGTKTKLNLMYFIQHNDNTSESLNQSNALFDNVQQLASYNDKTKQKQLEHRINGLLRHRLDSTAYFEYSPSLTLAANKKNSTGHEELNADGKMLNESNNIGNDIIDKMGYSHRLFIEKQIHPQHLLSFTNQLAVGSEDRKNNENNTIIAYSNPADNRNHQFLNQYEKRNNNTHSSVAYYNKLWEKLNFDWYLTYNTNSEKPDMQTYYSSDNSTPTRRTEFENNYRLLTEDIISGIKFYWKPKKDWIINFGTAFQIKENSFDFYDINQKHRNKKNYWLPNLSIRYKTFNLSWSKDISSPTSKNIWTQDNNLNPLRVRLHSLYFDNILQQTFALGFNRYTQKMQLSITARGNYYDKSVGQRLWIDNAIGRYTSQSYQAGSTVNTTLYAQLRYQIKTNNTWNIYTSTSPQYYTSQQHQEVNDITNRVQQKRFSMSQEFSITWNNKIGISPKYDYSLNLNRNKVKDNPDFIESNYSTHKIGIGLNILPIKGFSMETTYSLENRANGINSRKNFNMLNSSVYYSFKNQSQIKLSAFDILNQNSLNYWGTQGNFTYFSSNMTLRQYFLLGYIYKFNFTKTK